MSTTPGVGERELNLNVADAASVHATIELGSEKVSPPLYESKYTAIMCDKRAASCTRRIRCLSVWLCVSMFWIRMKSPLPPPDFKVNTYMYAQHYTRRIHHSRN